MDERAGAPSAALAEGSACYSYLLRTRQKKKKFPVFTLRSARGRRAAFHLAPPPCKRHTRPLISSAHPQYSPGGEGRGINSSSRLSDALQGVSPPTPPLSFFHSDLQREFRRGRRTSRSRRPHQTKSQLQWRKPSLPPPHSSLSLPLPLGFKLQGNSFITSRLKSSFSASV